MSKMDIFRIYNLRRIDLNAHTVTVLPFCEMHMLRTYIRISYVKRTTA